MKYIKNFENNNMKLKIGDYVLMSSLSGVKNEYQEFISNNIGIITNLNNIINDEVGVKYDYNNIPSIIRDMFSYDGFRIFYDYQITHISSNKQDLEVILNAKKYNL